MIKLSRTLALQQVWFPKDAFTPINQVSEPKPGRNRCIAEKFYSLLINRFLLNSQKSSGEQGASYKWTNK